MIKVEIDTHLIWEKVRSYFGKGQISISDNLPYPMIKKCWKNMEAGLLKDTLLRAINISSQVTLHFLFVDALSEKAKFFYLKYGFTAFEESPLTLVISLETIKATIS